MEMLTAEIKVFGIDPARRNYLPRLIHHAIYNELKELDTVPDVIELSPLIYSNMLLLFEGGSHGTMVKNNDLNGTEIQFSRETHKRSILKAS
jgi:hypothetical protein